MKNRLFAAVMIMASAQFVISCNKDDDDTNVIPPYTVPETYDFENVDYTEAAQSVSMWAGFTAYLGKSTSRQLSQDTANYMWNNTNSAFTAEIASNLSFTPDQLNAASTVKLSSLTAYAAVIKAYVDSMVVISQFYSAVGSDGVPGKIGSRLFNYSGLEFNQAVAKGMMGAFQMKKIFEHLDKSATADNSTVTPGKGTAMQHEWDLAFGYVGIPKADYVNRAADTLFAFASSNPARPLAIGGYFRERGTYIKAGQKVYDAFIKGRAAIAAKDYVVRDQAIATIKEFIEKTLAAAAYAYVTAPQTQADLAAKFHGISEGYGFVVALKQRSASSTLTSANYQALENILKTNFYRLAEDANNTKLKEAQTILTTAYGQLQAN